MRKRIRHLQSIANLRPLFSVQAIREYRFIRLLFKVHICTQINSLYRRIKFYPFDLISIWIVITFRLHHNQIFGSAFHLDSDVSIMLLECSKTCHIAIFHARNLQSHISGTSWSICPLCQSISSFKNIRHNISRCQTQITISLCQ